MNPRRPTNSRQTLASAAILVVLAAVAAGVFFKQFSFNAALTAPPAGPAAAAVADKPSAENRNLVSFAPAGMTAMSGPESFGPDTLSDKIDGKAELYLASGVVGMVCQRLRLDDADWMEVFAYDMGDGRNAFSVYSRQQRPGATKLDLGQFSYRSTNSLYLVVGRWYVEIVLDSTSPALTEAMLAYGQSMAKALAGEAGGGAQLDELAMFPAEHLVPDGISLVSQADFGVTGFDGAFVGRYNIDGRQVSAFLYRAAGADQAAWLARQYAEYYTQFGAQAEAVPQGVAGATAVEMFGIHKVAFARGAVVAGVHEAPSAQSAAVVAALMDRKLASLGPEALAPKATAAPGPAVARPPAADKAAPAAASDKGDAESEDSSQDHQE